MSESKPRPRPRDIAILLDPQGPTPAHEGNEGRGARILRIRDGNVSAGELRPLKEGESLTHSEVVRLHPLDAERQVCEVEVLHEPAAAPEPGTPAKTEERPRRARVSTASYRKNWSTVFEQKKKRRGNGNNGDDWSVN